LRSKDLWRQIMHRVVRRFFRESAKVNAGKTTRVVSIVITQHAAGQTIEQGIEVSFCRQLKRSPVRVQTRNKALLPVPGVASTWMNPNRARGQLPAITNISHPIKPGIETAGRKLCAISPCTGPQGAVFVAMIRIRNVNQIVIGEGL